MRFLGLLVALAVVLVAVALITDSAAPRRIPPGSTPQPTETVTFAQVTALPGWRLMLSLNSIRVSPVSACEYATPAPGTRRLVADVTLTPAPGPNLIAGPELFVLVDSGAVRESLRLFDRGSGRPLPPGAGERIGIAAPTKAPGTAFSLELLPDGLWGRIVADRSDGPRPDQV